MVAKTAVFDVILSIMIAKTSIIDHLLQKRWMTHLLFWSLLSLLFITFATLDSGSFKVHLIKHLALLPAQLMATYFSVYYLIPKLLLQKKYLRFFLLLVLSGYAFAALARLSIIYLAEPFFRVDFVQESILEVLADPFYLLVIYVPALYLVVFLFFGIKNIKYRFEEKHQIEVLQKEKVTAELQFLKAQIHPHFLFNTLNNLYALTLEKSDQAPDVVLKLSEMLDYMLYQCGDVEVSLAQEIELLENYVALESLRYGSRLDLVFNKNIDQPTAQIAPLILLSIVENAFKHGVSGNLKNPQIRIDLTLKNQVFTCRVFNTKADAEGKKTHSNNKKGIGSNNIKRQLDLIYPNSYRLSIDDQLATYTLTLEMKLL